MSSAQQDGLFRRPKVFFVMHTNPAGYPPIERAAVILRDNGWRVRVLGASGLATDSLDAHRIPGIDTRLVRRASGPGIGQKLRFAWFVVCATAHVLWWRPDWVYASDLFATPVAWLAMLFRRKVVYHEHDSPGAEPASAFVRALARARTAVLHRAPIVIAPSDARTQRLRSLGAGSRAMTVWNCPLRSEQRERTAAPDHTVLRLIYQGSIVPARLPLALLDAMARARSTVTLEVVGYETSGSHGYIESLRAKAAELGITDRVIFRGAMRHEAMLERTAAADVGVALFPLSGGDFNEQSMAGASNKAFEYLGCGTALLVTDLPDWQALFIARGVAIGCDPTNIESIAAALDKASTNRDLITRMGATGRLLVEELWNYETCFRPVLERMAAAIPR